MGKQMYESFRGKGITTLKRPHGTFVYWGDEILFQASRITDRNAWCCTVHGALLPGAPRQVQGLASLMDCADYAFKAWGMGDESGLFTSSEQGLLARHYALRELLVAFPEPTEEQQVVLDRAQILSDSFYRQFRHSRDGRVTADVGDLK